MVFCGIITSVSYERSVIMKNLKIHPFIYFIISITYLEIIMKYIVTGKILNTGLIYTLIFTIPIILLLTILTKSFNQIVNKILTIISMLLITVYFEIQYIFYNLFSTPFSFSTIGLADQALDFTDIIQDAILSHLPLFIVILIPLILLIILIKKIDNSHYHKESIITLIILFIISYTSSFITLIPYKKDDYSAYKLYYNIDDPVSIIDKFGLLTYTKIDIKRQLFGYELTIVEENPNSQNNEEGPKEPEEIDYGYNKLDIDFASLTSSNKNITSLNNYMSNQNPSNKTEYTGMFKGKNLIFILAEGFNEIAVDEQRTPTLYKLVNNGFVFKNFYSPVFLSTTGGEFQATTGLIPTQETLSLWKKYQPSIKYGLGNAFKPLGYDAFGYHNWTYTYYKRHLTMETLGFNNYLGCGNGLEERMNCGWLPYDSEMINVTTPDYLGKDKNFVAYYVTVSGHSPYNVNDNIGRHHFETVENLEYSTSVKYYLAAQVELDKMLETLINKLKESNQLDDTVIALVGDHYPYTLSTEEVNEVASYQKDGIIEINRSNFILWNSEIEEPIIVDKVGSQIDVLPTILNLFGVDYDSRLILGKDILSDADGIAMFSNRSWTTDYASYISTNGTFTFKEGKSEADIGGDVKSYIRSMNNKVANYFSISKMIIENDYYSYILGGE